MSYQSLVDFQYWTLIGQICNLFLQMYLFKRFLFKPIQMILAKRQNEVDSTYEEAAQAKLDAETAKADYEERLLTAHAEAEKITTRALESAKDSSAALLTDAPKDSAALRDRASSDIPFDRPTPLTEATAAISPLPVDLPPKVVHKALSPEQPEPLFEPFIADLGADV